MSAWKQFLSQDIIVEPFELNKSFTFPASQFTNSNVDIDRYLGVNGNFEFTQSLTGNNNDQYQVLIYNSAKELYYSNFLSSSYGSPLQTQSLFPGDNTAGDVFVGSPDSSGRYENYLQTTTNGVRYFPTGSSDKIVTLSIPSRLWGDYIQPESFVFKYSSSLTIIDDGEGNLNSSASFSWDTGELEYFYYSESVNFATFISDTQITWDTSTPPSGYTFISASWQGDPGRTPFIDVASGGDPVQEIDNQNVTYDDTTGQMDSDGSIWIFQDTTGDTGPALFTWMSSSAIIKSISAGENVGNIIYPHGMAVLTNQSLPLSDITTLANVTCSFSSSFTIYETQYKATISPSEFNFTQNPSALSGSNGYIYNYLTSSYFDPYVTTVGLYDEAQNLLAVGKLSQPLPTSRTTDTTIFINIDRT
jgi:hypothetical protein